jgi:hypothetical protein
MFGAIVSGTFAGTLDRTGAKHWICDLPARGLAAAE